MTLSEQRKEKLTKVLRELGKSRKQVAEFLKRNKIKGVPGRMSECPVAKYIKRNFRRSTLVEADYYAVRVYFSKFTDNSVIFVEVHTPSAVAKFMDDFDNPIPDIKYYSLVK